MQNCVCVQHASTLTGAADLNAPRIPPDQLHLSLIYGRIRKLTCVCASFVKLWVRKLALHKPKFPVFGFKIVQKSGQNSIKMQPKLDFVHSGAQKGTR